MFLNQFEGSIQARLQQVLHTLESVHGISFKVDLDSPTAESTLLDCQSSYEGQRDTIIKESAFNSYQQNPDYVKSILVLEAVKIMLTEIGPKRRAKKIAEGRMDLSDYLQQAIEATGSAGTSYDRVGEALKEIGSNIPSYHVSNAARQFINQAWEAFNQVPRGTNGSQGYDAVHTALVSAKQQMYKDWQATQGQQKAAAESVEQINELETMSPTHKMLADVGRAMVSYSEDFMQDPAKANSITDDKLGELNNISRVGEKLTQLGVAFGSKLNKDDLSVMSNALPHINLNPEVQQKISKTLSGVMQKAGMNEGVKDMWAGMKKSGRDFWNGTPEELDQEEKDRKAYADHVAKRNNPPEQEVTEAPNMNPEQLANLGRAMMDYSSQNHSDDERELAMMNAFSRVGDKLTSLDTPFGPKGLNDTDQKIVRLAVMKLKAAGKLDTGFKAPPVQPEGKPTFPMNGQPAAEPAHLQESVGNAHHYEYEASMARGELYRNTKYAMGMMKQIDPHGPVAPWVAAKLDKAAKALDKVYHYLAFKSTFEPAATPAEVDEEMTLDQNNGDIVRHNVELVAEYSIKLFDMIDPKDKLESWVAMKLTSASESVSSCKHYMDHDLFQKHGADNFMEGRRMTRKNVAETKLNEQDQEGLAKAQTILAAKDMSSKLQGMAEDVAKMAVEDLMPLVDIMRQQFGPEASDGFNQTAKAAMEQLLNTTTQTKEQFDGAVETLNTGGIPQQGSDLGNAPAMPGAGGAIPGPADSSGMAGDLADIAGPEAGPGAGGPPSDGPLGRSKKDGIAEAWDKKTKPSKDDGKWKGSTIAELKSKKAALMKKKSRSKAEQKTVSELNFAIRAKHKDKWGKVEESDGKACAECGKHFMKKYEECDSHAGKKPVMESTPPGKKAEDFIKGSKADFSKRYGKDADKYLYATAWKKFGPKNEAYEVAVKKLTEAKERLANLNATMEVHKKIFKKLVTEGVSTDPLNLGYGLEGDVIINKINTVNKQIERAKAVITSEMKDGIMEMTDFFIATVMDKKLANAKGTTPYGVIYTTEAGKKAKKMFEDADTRNYWLDLRGETIKDVKMVEPETFDKVLGKTA